ncbi:MAG TPA: nucleotidyltransferase [Blastocatellia bacterium]|nr:nucleotidyltransferase [Blastocatellia bacterium]
MSAISALIESDNEVFHQVLDEVINALDESGIKYCLMGGIAATALGGHRFTHDIDVFVKAEDADRVINVLAKAGFKTEKTDPVWLYKAFKNNVMVDIIFQSSGPIFLDDEMIERSTVVSFNGKSVRTLGPEDLFIIKSLVLNEHTLSIDARCMRHISDLLSILRVSELDWDYILKRARMGPRRILSMMLLGQSLDLLVPNRVVRELVRMLELC